VLSYSHRAVLLVAHIGAGRRNSRPWWGGGGSIGVDVGHATMGGDGTAGVGHHHGCTN
jgi:hypothetical protein